ncbi:hypothetical protein K469DRAFT_747261 [Zopfia rhizophila CBS 207.26]|uniref:Uncharacterized protein n=1 Tax=Zopfia rhizophila CBS 207.26 TaxID=1314779 RepID=A0A6A6EHU2_9PEZI|nr:hypothetical protein K469DRAFT_747261 [Zopfia rhizophila CBS 207.26]
MLGRGVNLAYPSLAESLLTIHQFKLAEEIPHSLLPPTLSRQLFLSVQDPLDANVSEKMWLSKFRVNHLRKDSGIGDDLHPKYPSSLSPTDISARPYTPPERDGLKVSDMLHDSPYSDYWTEPSYSPSSPESTRAKRAAEASAYLFPPDDIPASLHTHPKYTLRPLPPMPWDAPSSASPVQNLLFSCINNLEKLISQSAPNDEQMEYIIAQFESINAYLSAPEAQSRQPSDSLFDSAIGLGGEDIQADSKLPVAPFLDPGQNSLYFQMVNDYIAEVKRSADQLGERLEEVQELNSLLLDRIYMDRETIYKLRRLDSSTVPIGSKLEPEIREVGKGSEKKPGMGFWGAMGAALDSFAESFGIVDYYTLFSDE